MVAPYNAPADPDQVPTMDGFVADYISAFTAEMGRQPTYDEYSQIMTGYTPEQMPVLSTLARGFATFDHWFADVPSQTFTNRSFFHAATASGLVVNAPYANFPVHNTAETLFDRLEAHGLTWRVYCDPPSRYSLTGLIHAPRLRERFATNFFSTDQFFADAENGELPTYAFIEPQIIGHAHNDMHPAFSMQTPGLNFDPPSSLIAGEDLLARIYDAIRSSSSPTGSNCFNTLFMVVFDEHGGTYDHVPPPAATRPTRPDRAGQMDFTFDRLGIRLPAIAISPWIPEKTVVNDTYRNTSVIRTMRERWNLGPPLTARDADAADIAPVLTLDQPRAPEDWPDVTPRPVPEMDQALIPLDQPLSPLAQALVGDAWQWPSNSANPCPPSPTPPPSPAPKASNSCTKPSATSGPGSSTRRPHEPRAWRRDEPHQQVATAAFGHSSIDSRYVVASLSCCNFAAAQVPGGGQSRRRLPPRESSRRVPRIASA